MSAKTESVVREWLKTSFLGVITCNAHPTYWDAKATELLALLPVVAWECERIDDCGNWNRSLTFHNDPSDSDKRNYKALTYGGQE